MFGLPVILFARRSWLALIHDVFFSTVIFFLVVYFRWHLQPTMVESFRLFSSSISLQVVIFGAVSTTVFWFTGMYRGVWRYASIEDLIAIFRGVTLTVLIFTLILFLMIRGENLPRTAIVMTWFLILVYLPIPRIFFRFWRDGGVENLFALRSDQIPVILVGAGDEADVFIHAMRRTKGIYRAVAIIDMNHKRRGQSIRRVPVIGSLSSLQKYYRQRLNRNRPQRMIITKKYPPEKMHEILQLADSLALPVSQLPPVSDFAHKRSGEIEVQPIPIEDLLNRAQKPLDFRPVQELVAGKKILVTGAGGSIGSELVRQLARFGPESLLLVENSEHSLYMIDLELGESYPRLRRTACLADVRDQRRLAVIFADYQPELVFHAAALKHVPLVEINPLEAIHTNVVGTKNIADLCRQFKVRAMVLISSDKAVNPTNIMGATKRLAESWCQALDRLAASESDDEACHFVTVRFGNVLGSTGSVVPLFRRQLAMGGPLTVTDPEMTRYFMTIREAVSLVLQAAALGAAGRVNAGRIFILDMGKPVKIIDLAKRMIQLHSTSQDQKIEIAIIGIRPGEKLHEELMHDSEE
ncbi:MAG: nucleoside-diphosphate sugar epimerase/dehydratase, partial [Alphaproteobacteria bacterium]|nr:nucleoside-diphosphate sugar epimerase/dehydratase [Alphaproteobacteria bacterium]